MSDPAAMLAFVERWKDAFNTDVERLARELYAPEAVLNGATMGPGKLLRFERRVLDAAPRRRMEVVAAHPAGDVVTVEGMLLDPDQGDDWKLPFCAVLQLAGGKVVRDSTYTEFSRWPGMR